MNERTKYAIELISAYVSLMYTSCDDLGDCMDHNGYVLKYLKQLHSGDVEGLIARLENRLERYPLVDGH